jgi:oxygen-independent coproporphyrinogen-3 oxidase
VYLGGGTPTVLGADLLGLLLSGLSNALLFQPDCEITVEANPGTVDLAYFRQLRGRGVNRLSLGMQSLDNDSLALLGRIHSAQTAIDSVHDARRAGFDNINLDIMFGLPGQSTDSFRHTLDRALDLSPEHLSLYALTIEENTPLAHDVKRGKIAKPDPDLTADMYEVAQEHFAARGYIHYEISNWARDPAYMCRHNLRYWQRQPYIGLGAGAHSFIDGLRFQNTPSPEGYIQLVSASQHGERHFPGPAAEEVERIGRQSAMAEMMFLGLRMNAGVTRKSFQEAFGVGFETVYGDTIAELKEAGLVELDSRGIRLTQRGRLIGNEVFYRFLGDD